MANEIYNITWVNISDNLMAWYLRNLLAYDPDNENPTWLLHYQRVIMEAFQLLTNRLFETAFNINIKIKRTGQHGVLEITINDEFDFTLRRIYITDAYGATNYNYDFYKQGEVDPTPQSFYKQGEVDPAPKTFFTGGESAGEFDFYINIPAAVSYDQARLQGVVNTYKTSGKRYDLVTI
ncbi:MAG: hypothetical protein KAJ19_13345 [Gammaproteobacteria bacterium]|nr:hypothetical protein [Gammaproteobacteria bacterium]